MDSIKIFFNNTIIKSSDFSVDLNDRAFQYGDGVFETLVTRKQEVLFWSDHMDRLQRGLETLHLHLHTDFHDQLRSHLPALLTPEVRHHRVKIMVWRKPGGLYTPTEETANIMMVAQPIAGHLPKVAHLEKVGISEKVRLPAHAGGGFKTLSSLPYVLAGLEKKQKQWDELILLDYKGNIAEASSANLFWGVGNQVFTPSLETGCLAGILRKQILQHLPQPFVLQEVKQTPESLSDAEWAFTTNVTSIQVLRTIEKKALEEPPNALLAFIQDLYR